jgi:hypothetical protein
MQGFFKSCRVGSLDALRRDAAARKLADAGIAIRLVYATAGEGAEASIVMQTSDNAKAAKVLG